MVSVDHEKTLWRLEISCMLKCNVCWRTVHVNVQDWRRSPAINLNCVFADSASGVVFQRVDWNRLSLECNMSIFCFTFAQSGYHGCRRTYSSYERFSLILEMDCINPENLPWEVDTSLQWRLLEKLYTTQLYFKCTAVWWLICRIIVIPQIIFSVGLKYQNKHCLTTVSYCL